MHKNFWTEKKLEGLEETLSKSYFQKSNLVSGGSCIFFELGHSDFKNLLLILRPEEFYEQSKAHTNV